MLKFYRAEDLNAANRILMRALPAQKITRRVMLTFFVYVREKLTVVMTKTSPDYLVYAPVSLRQERKCCGHVRLPASH